MRIKNRALSFLLVTLVYAIATALGIITYNAFKLDWWLSLLIADILSTVVVFIFSGIFKNASTYDPYWSVQPLVIVTAFAIGTKITVVTLLPIIAIWLWGVRLTANWAYTFKGLTHQDWRYTMLNEKTGKAYPLVNFLGIHLFPTLVVYACCLPAVNIIRLGVTNLNAGAIIFFCTSILAVVLQTVSDIQMQAFRKKKEEGKASGFIRVGLWKYSRHPNYLGEILMWWGIGLYGVCAMPSSWYLLAGALVNTLMFLIVSIPMADRRQAQKQGYEEYKAQTRMLLPIKK